MVHLLPFRHHTLQVASPATGVELLEGTPYSVNDNVECIVVFSTYFHRKNIHNVAVMSGPYDGYPHVPPFYQPHHGPPVSQSEGYVPGYPHYHGLSSEYFAPAYHQVDEYGGQLGPAQATARVRRRIGAAGEHVKHRRTRSGCYTCRNRRVKVRGQLVGLKGYNC